MKYLIRSQWQEKQKADTPIIVRMWHDA